MSATDATLRVVAAARRDLDRVLAGHDNVLVSAWSTAWDTVAAEWVAAVDALLDGATAWPSRAKILRADRARRALAATETALRGAVGDSLGAAVRLPSGVAAQAAAREAEAIAASLPPDAAARLNIASWDRVSPDALDAIVRRTTQRITALHRPLSADTIRHVKSVLVRGVAVGENPRRAATRMVDRLERAIDLGRVRAQVIARTEILDAYRAAQRAQDSANSDVVTGWVWTAELSTRTCPSCWGMHGTVHPLTESGPDDHQQGRCTSIPATKTWRELGFSLIEPESVVPDAEDVFSRLSPDEQRLVMGPERLDLLQSGRVGFSDLATRRSTDGWRDSWAPTPVASLRTKAAAA